MSTTQDDPNTPQPALRIRITHITSTQSPPLAPIASMYRPPQSLATSFPPGILPDTLPIIRIFGTTSSLQKICANVHLCFPYFYVPFPMDTGGNDPLSPENVNKVAFRFGRGLNHAICLAMRQDPFSAANTAKYGGSVNPKHLHVVSVSIVKGVPFYGYHVGYTYYLKVSLVNPSRMYVAMEQLRKPVVLGRVWQPHEAHFNHVLQFMADFDLYGCGWLDVEAGKFREPLPVGDPFDASGEVIARTFDSLSTPESMRYLHSPPRDTYSSLEIDILPNHIINRRRLQPRNLHHDFIELLHQPLNPHEKLVRSMKELWEDEKRRRAVRGFGSSEDGMMPKEHEVRTPTELGYLLGDEAPNRGGHWQASEDLWAELEARMVDDRKALGGQWDFARYAEAASRGKHGKFGIYEKWIMTAFDSVASHWPNDNAGVPSAATGSSEYQNPFEVYSQQQRNADEYDQQQASQDVNISCLSHIEESRLDASGEPILRNEIDDEHPAQAENDDYEPPLDEEGAEAHFREMLLSQVRTGPDDTSFRTVLQQAGLEGFNDTWLSSVSPDSQNPYLTTHSPLKPRISPPVTPHSNTRSQFSLPRPTLISPLKTPTKPSRLRHTAVMLPSSRRAASNSPPASSPEFTAVLTTTPMPVAALLHGHQASASGTKVLSVDGKDAKSPPEDQSVVPETVWTPTVLDMLECSSTALDRDDSFPSGKRVRMASVKDETENSLRGSTGRLAANQSSAWSSSTWIYTGPLPQIDPEQSMEDLGMASVIYRPPYYSRPSDVPALPKTFAGRQFLLKGDAVEDLDEFETSQSLHAESQNAFYKRAHAWEYAEAPPGQTSVQKSIARRDGAALAENLVQTLATSQIDAPTQKNKFGFKFSQRKKTKASQRQQQNMSVLALEVFAPSREHLLPDPDKDAIAAIFYCFQNEDDSLEDTTDQPGYHAGYVAIADHRTDARRAKLDGIPCHYVDTELDLFNWVVDTVKEWDPDVLTGWELHNSSWGYLASRAMAELSYDLCDLISRVRTSTNGGRNSVYDATHTTNFKVPGRHVLNIWRILRSEVNLTSYSFESVVFQVLRQRTPRISAQSLTALWRSKTSEHTVRVMRYMFDRTVMYIELLDAAEVVTKNAEFARVFGVDFASVLTRGSQYKVESFMIRIAKPENFMLVSPSKQQVGLQNAPDAIPLIAEPESKYYSDPIVVLDFQSLYPSVMIAYNLCYSTCLGRVKPFKGTWKFGFDELRLPRGTLELLKPYLTVTPNGVVFVKPAVRKSLLAKMLGEILDTRVMVKTAMKSARGDKALMQLLNARQLGLKLMANVTYGYTSATFSGRMPCIEIADSIVQTGRETLMKAHDLIHSRKEWGARVVYGDTDSLFLSLPGRTKEQAFKIGNEVADAVTAMNPKPVKLKFEKVYMGSVLMAKKRYVGNKYDHIDDAQGVFDAKGIETVRRDGFPAQAKLEEICLKQLFVTQDLSKVKEQCQKEWTKIIQGKVSLQDFIIAKEVRLGTYSDKAVPPAGVIVATRRLTHDPRDEAQYGERVPYLIVAGEGNRLVDRARTPEEMVSNRSLQLDTEYYIRKGLIPCLSRIFNLIGADVESWYNSMSKTYRVNRFETRVAKHGKIDGHFYSSHCYSCGQKSDQSLCPSCREESADTSHKLMSRFHLAQRRLVDTHLICCSCMSIPLADPVLCNSVDCPSLFTRVKAEWEAEDAVEMRALAISIGKMEW